MFLIWSCSLCSTRRTFIPYAPRETLSLAIHEAWPLCDFTAPLNFSSSRGPGSFLEVPKHLLEATICPGHVLS